MKNDRKKMNPTIYENIEYIGSLMAQSLKMPVCFIDSHEKMVCSFMYGYIGNPLHGNQNELFIKLFPKEEWSDLPIIKSTEYHENYFAVGLKREGKNVGSFIVGPSTYAYITADTIDTLITENRLSLSYKKQLIDYYNTLSVLDYTRLVSASVLLYYCVYQVKLDINEVIEKNSVLSRVPVKVESEIEESMSKNRQNVFFHHSTAGERSLMNCIKIGDKERLLGCYNLPRDGEPGILSRNSPIRAHKNLMICSVTLATRAAIEGGLDSELAYTLSDLYIQEIEETHQIKDLVQLDIKMLCDFADRVKRHKEHKYSKAVNKCQSYILNHLYEEITLAQLAEYVNLHPNYLSELFKKQTGTAISQYIQKEKIEEAKRLLASSHYSILDIAGWLHFHDQSHFTRVFKKSEGITPKKYKDIHHS